MSVYWLEEEYSPQGPGGQMKRHDLIKFLMQHQACPEAMQWTVEHPTLSPSKLWRACPRGDWLLWLAEKAGVERKLIVLAACDCARTALKYVAEGEDRPRIAIETAEAWCRGDATIEEVQKAAGAAEAWAAGAARAAAMAAEAARNNARKLCAQLVRKRITWAMVEKALEGK